MDPKITRALLSSIIEFHEANRPGLGNVALYKLVAEKLNRIAMARWSWRYIQGIHAGTINPGKKIHMATLALGAALDDVPSAAIYTIQVTVFARPETIEPGSIILAPSKNCKRFGCPISFVPNVPWRQYCSAECSAQAHRPTRELSKKDRSRIQEEWSQALHEFR